MKITPAQLRRIIKEEISAMTTVARDPNRFLHGYESGQPHDDEGYMLKSRMSDVKDMAETICDLIDAGDQLPAWVQDLVASAHTDLEHVKDYLVGDETLRSMKPSGMKQKTKMESRRRSRKYLNEVATLVTDTHEFDQDGQAAVAAASELFEDVPSDEIEFAIDDSGVIYTGAGLHEQPTMTHEWKNGMWEELQTPVIAEYDL